MLMELHRQRCSDQQSLIAMIAKPALPEFKPRLTDDSPITAGRLCRCYNQSLTIVF